MPNFHLQLTMVAGTMLLFMLTLTINEWLFAQLEFAPGINWIYLPAGIRLLGTILFAEAGALGLLLISWLLCFFYFFPGDYLRSFMGGIIAALGPYLVYRATRVALGRKATIDAMSAAQLLMCIIAYSIATPLLMHAWLALQGHHGDLLRGFIVMFAGDLAGTLIVVLAYKGLVLLLPRQAA